MTPQSVSVIVVSRGRPEALRLCLTGIGQLLYPSFEIVVVADKAGCDMCDAMGLTERIKGVLFDQPNISEARNSGIAAAAGEIVAFIDDDAVPEPTWLSYLAAPFADPDVAASGGFVLGRNGISHQWCARDITAEGQSHDLSVDPDTTTLMTGCAGQGIKTEGTNMAVRRDVLALEGGFDPSYRFYLDESDLNMRLARSGLTTAIVPRAIVHHGFRASDRRRGDRVPRDLHEIGASLAVFLRKHRPDSDHSARWAQETSLQRARLLRHMVAGRLEPRDVARLKKSLAAGQREGAARDLAPLPPLPRSAAPFLAFQPLVADAGHRLVAGWRWQRDRLLTEARESVAAGFRVSLYLFSFVPRYHRVSFHPDGFWLQQGGLWSRSDRHDPVIRPWSMRRRLARERERVIAVREGLR